MHAFPAPALIISIMLLTGCAGSTDVISTDLTRQSGLYVVGYVDREDVRAMLEDRFVKDLATQDMRGVASRHDLPAVKKATPADIVKAANSHQVAAILIINRVSKDGSDSIIDSEQRIAPDDPDLNAYYEATRAELDNFGDDEAVWVEVNAFFVDGRKTRRFWSGTSWTFAGETEAAVNDVSASIAAQVAEAARELRSYSRPMQ